MKETKNLRNSALLLLLSTLFLIGTTFAWVVMAQTNSVDPLIVSMGDISGEVKFYIGNDENRDGTLEEDSNNSLYYLSDELKFNKCVPGDIFSFKLEINNTSTYDNIHYMVKLDKDIIYSDFNNNEDVLKEIIIIINEETSFSLYELLNDNNGYLVEDELINSHETKELAFKIELSTNIGNVYQSSTFKISRIEIRFLEK